MCVGIGGGGDVVGALGVAEVCRALGTRAHVGGVTWERRPVDPRPGPRRLDEVGGIERIAPAAALAGPDAGVAEEPAFVFAEGHMAAFLGEPVALLDPNAGPAGVADGLAAAAARLDCDLVILVDVGGDVLAHGDEPGLASPLCDAVLLAAAPFLAGHLDVLGAIFGVGCDGELTPAEVLARLAEVAAAQGGLGAWGLEPPAVQRLEAAVASVPTEASAQALACARGALGPTTIRAGRRTVERSPVGGLVFFFAPEAALASAAGLATAVRNAPDLEAAEGILAARGVRTELAGEREPPAA